jgi:F-type H+-transporting ATPase subunit delta
MRTAPQARREARQLYRLCLVQGRLDEDRARRVVQQIVAAHPRGYHLTLTYFRRLVKLDCAQHTAKVESALPLPPELQARVQTSLVQMYGPGLSLSFAEQPKLIGGMRIQVGSDVYDGSVQARLAAIEHSF